MSRAADLANRKGEQKANLKEKNALKEAHLAIGLTNDMKKLIVGDTLVCSVCWATTMGPKTACECPGGRTKPTADYDPAEALVIAAKARSKLAGTEKRLTQSKSQAAVQKDKEKKKGGADDLADLDLSTFTADLVEKEFEAKPLGFSIVRNAVSAVSDEGQAKALGVKVGWLIKMVGTDEAPQSKDGIMKLAAVGIKSGSVKFTFQTPDPERPDDLCCRECQKFLDREEFEAKEIAKGPGKTLCSTCYEFAGLF
ncbi:hypothetical protein FOA52_006808 [Chlamydomonas sp. UWO 241]|nr:hypothetical protein FOA52_006808 [Chlamydomonas sp. UWO 241]